MNRYTFALLATRKKGKIKFGNDLYQCDEYLNKKDKLSKLLIIVIMVISFFIAILFDKFMTSLKVILIAGLIATTIGSLVLPEDIENHLTKIEKGE